MNKELLLKLAYAAAIAESLANAASFFLPLYLKLQLHFSVPLVGTAITLLGAGTLAGSFSSSIVCKFFTEFTGQVISFIIMAVCLVLLAAVHNVILINVIAFFLGAGMFLFRPTNQVWMFSLVTKNKQVHANNVRRMVLNQACRNAPQKI